MHISLVDRDGAFHARVYKPDVLATLDRSTEHLVQVSVPSASDDPYTLPTCRIFLKSTLRARAKQLEDSLKAKAKVAKSSKVIEISWVIAPADLEMKCKQVRGFLEEGRKVDVVLLPPERRRGWKSLVTQAGMSEIMSRVQREVDDIDGAAEVGKPDGTIGATMTIVFQGKK
jgi:translation initiation factor IF-3